MGVLFEYFGASTDEMAVSVIDRGPLSASVPVLDAARVSGIDPVVQMGKLESILTGTPYEEVRSARRAGNVLAVRGDGELLVVKLSCTLQAALAGLDDDHLPSVAAQWGETEEFQLGGPQAQEGLRSALGELAGLARRASAAEQQLYCWVCV